MCYVLASASLKLAVPGCWVALHCMRASRFESLRRYVAVEKFRAVRKKILPFAEAQGLLSDEDVFKALS